MCLLLRLFPLLSARLRIWLDIYPPTGSCWLRSLLDWLVTPTHLYLDVFHNYSINNGFFSKTFTYIWKASSLRCDFQSVSVQYIHLGWSWPLLFWRSQNLPIYKPTYKKSVAQNFVLLSQKSPVATQISHVAQLSVLVSLPSSSMPNPFPAPIGLWLYPPIVRKGSKKC